MTRAVSAVLPAIPRPASNKELDASALQAIAQAAVNVELFTIPLYMGTLYSIQGTHQITGKNDFYKDRLWPGPAPTAARPERHAHRQREGVQHHLLGVHRGDAAPPAGVAPRRRGGRRPRLRQRRACRTPGGWTCYGPQKTVIPHIVDLRDTKTYDDVKVDIAAISADQMKLFIAIEQPETDAQDDLKPLADRPSGNEYFPTVPFDDWTTHSTEEDLPMFGTIGAMYQCYLDYMAITYDDDTTLWDYVFFANQRDLFNVQAKGHPKREYPGFDATLGAAGFRQAMDMMDAITDQGEGSLLVRPPPRADALRMVDEKYQASLEALKADYPSFTDTGEDAPSAAAAARSERGGVDHYERFREVRDELLPEVVTWKDWFADHGPWTARDLRTTDDEPRHQVQAAQHRRRCRCTGGHGDRGPAGGQPEAVQHDRLRLHRRDHDSAQHLLQGAREAVPLSVDGRRRRPHGHLLGGAGRGPEPEGGRGPAGRRDALPLLPGARPGRGGRRLRGAEDLPCLPGVQPVQGPGGLRVRAEDHRWWAQRVPAGRHQGGRRRRRGRLFGPQRQQVRRLRGLRGPDLGVPDLPRLRAPCSCTTSPGRPPSNPR